MESNDFNYIYITEIKDSNKIITDEIRKLEGTIFTINTQKKQIETILNDKKKKYTEKITKLTEEKIKTEKSTTEKIQTISVTCTDIETKKLLEKLKLVKTTMTKIDLKTSTVENYINEIIVLIKSPQIQEIINSAEKIRKLHAEVASKIGIYFQLLRLVKQTKKTGSMADFSCIQMGMRKAAIEIERVTSQISAQFDALSKMDLTMSAKDGEPTTITGAQNVLMAIEKSFNGMNEKHAGGGVGANVKSQSYEELAKTR